MRKIASLFTMFMLFSALAFGQNRTITGTVSNEKGEAVPGATIVIKGTRTGVSADNNGLFRILAKTGDILVASSSGMETSEVTVEAASTINFTTKTLVLAGTEVVVTALGIKRQPKELGYAVAKVGGTELTQARTVNLQNGLTGKVSGLNIQTVNNGVFADTRITLRGIRSLTGNNQPLLVLDGVPMALGFINSINPNDIQDVTVLKGNTGAALYGQDGTNGAIIVTTKKGSKGRTRITVGSSFQAEKVSFLPDLQNEFGSGETENIDGTAAYDYFTNNSFGPRFDGSLVPLGDFLEDGSRLYVPYSATNPARKFWNTGTTFQNDISFSGGDEKSTFLFSVQDARIRGIVPKDENRRTSFRFNATKNFDKLSVGFNVSYIQSNYNVVNQNRGGFDNIYTTIMKTSPFIPIKQFEDWKNNKFATADGWYNHFGYNPYMLIDIDRNKGRSDDIIGNIDLTYKLSRSLTLSYRLGTTVSVGSSKSYLGAINVSPYTAVTRGTAPWGQSTKGSVSDALSLGNRITSEAFITYRKEFNKLTLDLLGGQSLIQRYSKSISVSGNDLVIPELYNISNRTGEPGASEGISRIRTLAVFGKATFGWNKFAFLELTARNEADSRLNINKNTFFYPGASLSILFSEAIPAIKNSSIISYMKLRSSYAKSANVNLNPYSLESTFSGTAGGFPYGTLPGFTTGGTVNNPLIKPEFVSTYEVGLELGMLKNRVFLEASVYTADNSDQIIGVQVSRATGYTNALVNAATFQNKGIELDLKLTPLVSFGKNVSVDLKMNYTHLTNKVTKIYEGLDELGIGNLNYAIVGKPAFVMKLIDWARDTATGSVIVGNSSGLPSLNAVRTTMGGTMPRDLFGATLAVRFKNFSFTVVADYRGGNFVYHDIGGDLGFNGVSALTTQYDRKPFVFPNSVIKNAAGKYVQNTTVLTPGGINWWTASTFYNNETVFYTKADFWKIREASLSYEVPQKVFSKANSIKGITITLTGRNLLTVLPNSNVYTDPEFGNTTGNAQGVNTSFNTPPTRIFGAAVNVNF